MRRLGALAALAASALAFSACAAMNVSAHADRAVDFARFATYDWGPADALPTGDRRLDGNPHFHDLLQGAVEKEMARRGFAKVAGGAPDLLLHYHANVSSRLHATGVDSEYGCAGDHCEPRFDSYENASLVLDVVDNAGQRVIWRGWAQRDFGRVIDDYDALRQYVTEGVTRMMARFPVHR
jgi:hypothetical protein